MIENQLRDVALYLQSKHIKITEQNEWLIGCCEWFHSNNPQSNSEERKDFVYSQWLLADLRELAETAESSFPANVAEIRKTTINGRIILQVDSVLDVSESCYSQMLKIRNVNTTNLEVTEIKPQDWEPKKKRMLKLTCTDGVQTIYGMEYKPIPLLREPLVPGFKVLIIGPVECRRGTLLLEAHNIQMLGGESDSLVVKNAVENILARRLNLPENPNPLHPAQLQDGMANMNVADNEEENNAVQPMNNIHRSQNVDEFSDNDDDLFLSEHLTQMEHLLTSGTLPTNNANALITTSRTSQPNISSAPATMNNSNFALSTTSRQTNSFPVNTGTFQSFSSLETNSSTSNSSRAAVSGNNAISNDINVGVAHAHRNISPDNFSSKRPAPSPGQPDMKMARLIRTDVHEPRPRNFQTFNENIGSSSVANATTSANLKIGDLKNFVGSGVRKCKASFSQMTSKPKIRDEKWQLTGEIKDETGSLNVAFSDSFLEKMYEFSAVEILSQKERMKSNPDVKERIDTILRRGVNKITSLKGEFHIEFSNGANLPKVLNVTV